MSKRNDGGPAFPTPWDEGFPIEGGMTLRDYFAAAALQGMLACPTDAEPDLLADDAYRHADAMLVQREKS